MTELMAEGAASGTPNGIRRSRSYSNGYSFSMDEICLHHSQDISSPQPHTDSGDCTKSDTLSHRSRTDPPDGGYGWVIVFAVFLSNMLGSGHFMCTGIYLRDLTEYFNMSQASMSAILAVEAIVASTTLFFVPMVVRRLGERTTCMLGGVISGTGVLLGSLMHGYIMFLLTYGVLKSLGRALIMIPSNVMIQKYFSRQRALAAGLGSTGMSAGTLCFSPLHRVMIDAFGWRGGLLLFSGLTFQGVVFSALLRPLDGKTRAFKCGKNEVNGKSKGMDDMDQPKMNGINVEVEAESSTDRGDSSGGEDSETVTERSSEAKDSYKKCPKLNSCAAVCNKWVMVLISAKCLGSIGVVSVYKYTVSNAVFHGIDPLMASLLPAMIGLGSTCSRLVSGWLSSLPAMRNRKLIQLGVALSLNGAVAVVNALMTDVYVGHAVCSLAFGICLGTHEAIAFTVVTDVFGLKRLSAVMSASSAMNGITVCAVLPLLGYLCDVTGDFRASFLLAGSIQVVGGLVAFLLVLPTRRVRTWDVNGGMIETGHGTSSSVYS